MNILVTGAAGFIGRHTVRAFRTRGYNVIEADIKTGQDMTNRRLAYTLVKGADRVVHLAASSSTPRSVQTPMQTFDDTVLTAAAILDACRWHRVPLVMVTSVKARDGKTPYGAAKRMVELWAEEYAQAYQMPVTIVRPGTVYGPGQEGSPESGWIAWFVKAKKEGLEVTLNGDGAQTRDLLYVDDLVELFLRMVREFGDYGGEKWDVGGGVENAVTVQQIADHLGLEYRFGPPRYGDADSYIGINDAPLWLPTTAWRDGLKRCF